MVTSATIHTRVLRQKRSPNEFQVYRAGIEWDLVEPIAIDSRDDFKSEHRWREHLEPYHHQVSNLITFCRRLPVTLLADDVGLGKTISAGLVISELIARNRLSKILIVCPKLLGPQWQEELKSKFDIPAEIAVGQKLSDAEPSDTGAVITTYQSARLYLDRIPQDRFQMLVLDEAHKLRNLYGVDPPPQVAIRFRKALEERRFRFVLMLTATPIQNRLWDLYSLVDLLTVARGHQNPFGSTGTFARKFIADSREKARQLKPESRDEFRSIVYGYMSRVRRGDAKLYFPERVVQMHRVEPTEAELQLIKSIAKPIQKLNRLAQISILQALASSPDALLAQLTNMARNGTVPAELAAEVRSIVSRMPTSAKLLGLQSLVEQLKREDPERWRLVVFTTRRETQTTIESFLAVKGLKVGIINGDSGARNQDTIARFRKSPPDCHVIVSTEAGSEGVNLQVANVLINFDLPWNPMIVEQRIGRVQRLASVHAKVGIFNIMLRGTFEEFIVGRLMEKLQLASHAVGDIEALLEASGVGDDEDGGGGFEDKIRQLIVAALSGKDVERATRLAEQSIENAKLELEREEAAIGEMLGSMDGAGYTGPRAPSLPPIERSMTSPDFVLAAFNALGAHVTQVSPEVYKIEESSGVEYVRLGESDSRAFRTVLYEPGTPAFDRLVGRVIATGICDVDDRDQEPLPKAKAIAKAWIDGFNGLSRGTDFESAERCFAGTAFVRAQANVAHDSYERLIQARCSPSVHHGASGRTAIEPIGQVVDNPKAIGIDLEQLASAARVDPAISEFCRFYLERRDQETQAAGSDERKRKKLEDEFTPRLSMTIVGLQGRVHRRLKIRARYQFDGGPEYTSVLEVVPSTGEIADAPPLTTCGKTFRPVPRDCVARCDVSGTWALRHLLERSQISGRAALADHVVTCGLSGKRILVDESETSAVTNQPITKSLMKASALSGKRAEPEHFGQCDFTKAEVLKSELRISNISAKLYRIDEECRSVVSGKVGHKHEFILCHETRVPIAVSEAEQCESTGYQVRPGILETCRVTHQRVLPSELERCAVTGKRALRRLLVTSNVSQSRFLEGIAIRSSAGNFCAPDEARDCTWSGIKVHPEDVRVCSLIGLPIHFKFGTSDAPVRLRPLVAILDGTLTLAEKAHTWDKIASALSSTLRGARCHIDAATLSPNGELLAACAKVRTLLGLRLQRAGIVYSLRDNEIVGRVARGKRVGQRWVATK